MRTLLTALAVTMLIGGSAVIWKAEAGMISGVGSLPLTSSYSPVEKVRQRYRRGYEYDHHYGLRPYRRDYGYPRPGCTFAIREYQRRWPYQLWPPGMRCFPYPN
jgi:hypothetical protein